MQERCVLVLLVETRMKSGYVPRDVINKLNSIQFGASDELPTLGALRIHAPVSHHNLALYLECSGAPSALAESRRHRLAALIYQLVSGLTQELRTMVRNYAIDFRRAHAGTELHVPRVAELLAAPAFRPLDDWLRQRQADVGEVQAAVDRVLDQARQLALEQE